MRIDRSLRAIMSSAYPIGYRAATPSRLNTESAQIALSPKGCLAQEDLNGPPFPESLALMVRLNPQRIAEPIRISLTTDTHHWPSLTLYDAHSKFSHRCVHLLYQGLGKVQWQNGGTDCPFRGYHVGPLSLALLGTDGIIFEKAFLHQSAAILVHKKSLPNGRTFVTPPGEENSYPLWSHGGFFELGCSITTIEQGVFTLASTPHATCTIATSPLSFWKNKTRAVSGETIRFLSDFKTKHWRTLAGDIESGQVRIDLCYGVDDYGETCRQIYRSCRFTQNDLSHGILEVFFTKEES